MSSRTLARILVLFALPALALAAEKASVGGLLKDGKKFDQKEVAVTGFVKDFQQKTSKIGNKYFNFKLKEGKDADEFVSVYSRGTLEKGLKDDAKVEVTGFFRLETKVGSYTYKNEIDCSPKEGKKFGVKELK